MIGASGGAKIISGVAYVASRALWMNETIKEAMDAPRIYNQLVPNVVEYERDFDAALVQKLTGSTTGTWVRNPFCRQFFQITATQ